MDMRRDVRPEEDERKRWHTDKVIPLPVLLAMAVQTVTIVWWLGTWTAAMGQRMDQVERRLAAFSSRSEAADTAISNQARDLAVLANKVSNVERQLDRVESQTLDTYNLIRDYLSEVRNGDRNQ